MTTQPKGSIGANLKIERAKELFNDLDARITAFREAHPYRVLGKLNQETREYLFYASISKQPPTDLGPIIGDVAHNLRSALDVMICDLVIKNSRRLTRQHGFPICINPDEFKAALRAKVKAAGDPVMQVVERLKPYTGGNAALVDLHELNRHDKHRLLITAFSYAEWGDTRESFLADEGGLPRPSDMPPRPKVSAKFPLEDGAILAKFGPYPDPAKVEVEAQIAVVEAFSEPPILKRKPVIPVLNAFIDVVEQVHEEMAPFFN